jgi:hypothetical protein
MPAKYDVGAGRSERSTPEFMKDSGFHFPEMTRRAMESGHSFDYMQTELKLLLSGVH